METAGWSSRPGFRLVERVGFHLVIWCCAGCLAWIVMRAPDCNGLCAVSNALEAYAVLALGALLSGIMGAAQIFFVILRT